MDSPPAKTRPSQALSDRAAAACVVDARLLRTARIGESDDGWRTSPIANAPNSSSASGGSRRLWFGAERTHCLVWTRLAPGLLRAPARITVEESPLRDGDLEGKDVVGAGRLDALHVVAHPAWCPTGRCLISSSLLTVPLEVVETAVLVDELAEVGELERVLLVRVDGGSRARPG